MRAGARGLPALAALAGCSLALPQPPAQFRCPDGLCPPLFACGADLVCRPADGGGDAGSQDAGPADGGPSDAGSGDAGACGCGPGTLCSTSGCVALVPLPTPRCELAAVTLPDGRIFTVGGSSDPYQGPLGVVEVYDPAANRWDQSLPPLPTPRLGLAAAVSPAGVVYAVGGWTTGPTAVLEAFSLDAGSWTQLAPMTHARFLLAAAMGSDGRLIALGGSNPDGGDYAEASVEAYDPTLDRWSALPDLAIGRIGPGAAVDARGTVYAIGGSFDRGVEALVAGASGWSNADALLTTGRAGLACALDPSGLLFVAGGWAIATQGAPTAAVDQVALFADGGASTAALAPMPTARSTLAAALSVGPDGRRYFYAFGGTTAGQSDALDPLATVEAYAVGSGGW